MNGAIDRVARDMTSGQPRPRFADRVMARLDAPREDMVMRVASGMTEGDGPRAGFAARVAARLDEKAPVAAGFWVRVALAGVPVAAVVMAAVIMRGGTPSQTSAPVTALATPPVSASTPERTAAASTPATLAVHTPRAARRGSRVTGRSAAIAELPAIYEIDALHGPSDIEMKSIEPAACSIPALTGPAPLKVNDLPGSGGSQTQREKP
ncbi:MAG: hypothetical protein M3R55_05495 [Acidobacteriota bacterium]|nr:hypothetical protein [Acidobacteriota bacterium]